MPKKVNNKLINEILKAQGKVIKCLVFSGGGAKAIIYYGVNEALTDYGIIDKIDTVCGSSAGAFNALAIALGLDKDVYSKFFKELNLKTKFGEQYFIFKDMNPVLDFFSSIMINGINKYLEKPRKTIDQKMIQEIKQIQEKNPINITFKDFHKLHKIDPKTFKKIAISAIRKDDGTLKIFDYENDPDTSIIKAIRCTGSLPILFKPYKLNDIEFADSGLKDNMPISYFKQKDPESRLLAFNLEGDFSNISIFSNESIIIKFSNLTCLLFNILQYCSSIMGKALLENWEESYQTYREYALEVLSLFPSGMSLLSFQEAQDQIKFLRLKGYNQAVEYLYNYSIVDDISSYHLDEKNFITGIYEKKIDSLYTDYVLETIKPIIKSSYIEPIKDFTKPTIEFVGSIIDAAYFSINYILSELFSINIKNINEKANEILDFAEPEYWRNKDSHEVLLNFIKKILTEPNGNLSIHSLNLCHFINQINENYTPISLKGQMAYILGLDRIDPNSITIEEDVIELKFEQKDFIKFTKENSYSQYPICDQKIPEYTKQSFINNIFDYFNNLIYQDHNSEFLSEQIFEFTVAENNI